jgi:hypothetical protein
MYTGGSGDLLIINVASFFFEYGFFYVKFRCKFMLENSPKATALYSIIEYRTSRERDTGGLGWKGASGI